MPAVGLALNAQKKAVEEARPWIVEASGNTAQARETVEGSVHLG